MLCGTLKIVVWFLESVNVDDVVIIILQKPGSVVINVQVASSPVVGSVAVPIAAASS